MAAVNPCPCGYAGDPARRCSCPVERVRAYRARLSGPLLDRIDLQILLPPVDVTAMHRGRSGEPSEAVRARVVAARDVQVARHRAGEVDAPTNAAVSARSLDKVARPDEAGDRVLVSSVERLGLSARAYSKVLRVARTIADLEGATSVRAPHVAEAIQSRLLDRHNAGANASERAA